MEALRGRAEQLLNSTIPARLRNVAGAVSDSGGVAYLVGGQPRDAVLQAISAGDVAVDVPGADWDVEIHGLELARVRELLSRFGPVNEVGHAFGVIKQGDYDFSLPRLDSRAPDANLRGIVAATDPHMGLAQASRRRDFTCNALALNLATGQIEDHHGGLDDLAAGRLVVVDRDTFGDDPLRVLRAMGAVGRFNLNADAATVDILCDTVPGLARIPAERIFDELTKLLTKSPAPAAGLRLGHRTGVLGAVLPAVTALEGIPQDREHHPEGDCLEHSFQSVNGAAIVARREGRTGKDLSTLLWAALLHDVGKAPVWFERGDAIGHDRAGADIARATLTGLRADADTAARVTALVGQHMAVHTMASDITNAGLRRLAARLAPATIVDLCDLSEADVAGRNNMGAAYTRSEASAWVLGRSADMGADRGPAPDVIGGKDLIAAGFKPGRAFSSMISEANELADDGCDKAMIFTVLHQQYDHSMHR